MQFLTREQARRNIVALGLPQIILDAFDEKPLPYNLDIHFRFPYQVFSYGPMQQGVHWKGPITPIWTGSGDYTIVAYDQNPERSGYIRFDIEDGEPEDPMGLNWQQILVKEFKLLWELETPDDRLREVAKWFDFKHVEELIRELPRAKLDSFEKDTVWYQSFLKRVGG